VSKLRLSALSSGYHHGSGLLQGEAVDRLRIAVIHSFYSGSQPSGENSVVLDQASQLNDAGHAVMVIGRHTDHESQRPGYMVRSAWGVTTGRGTDPSNEIRAFRPDVVHIHNLFPNLGTRWVRQWIGPVAVSLHNYRFACANGLLFRNNQQCCECPDRGMLRSVIHGCYRDSRVASIPLAVSRRADQKRVLARADAVITTSHASDSLLRSIVTPPMKTYVVPNFGGGEAVTPLAARHRRGWIALGRMTPEKGLLELARAWPDGHSLTIIGDGPQFTEIQESVGGREINVHSSVGREEMRTLLPKFIGLVFPSQWPEVAPQVIVEGMRVGLPVVAFRDNGVAEVVSESGAGRLYGDAASLTLAVQDVSSNCEEFSKLATDYYSKYWRPEVWLASMERVYADIIKWNRQ